MRRAQRLAGGRRDEGTSLAMTFDTSQIRDDGRAEVAPLMLGMTADAGHPGLLVSFGDL